MERRKAREWGCIWQVLLWWSSFLFSPSFKGRGDLNVVYPCPQNYNLFSLFLKYSSFLTLIYRENSKKKKGVVHE